jgi:uncharacterized repeat protein (TIGR03803 family)
MRRLDTPACIAMSLFIALAMTVRPSAQEAQPSAIAIQNPLTFNTLFSFQGSDGANPYTGMVMDTSGNLYGTTINGGTYGNGIVFQLGWSVAGTCTSAM